ncbi:3-hydroxybutyrate dehydrogenase [Mesobacillus selenatarsenatis]|uniref:D-beta-hydroxybutyrate dehydrogenase n=1 Tax=Mesobacillus selenatarsenatis (strain DSM 18680 / JCM 14380 / FERM P-15431 / SF-1) TaxID=1321606 RepID=A0A0A8X5E6_MESS1|nr:3-hydroxybutyrate dehydrogenase [Mesobacillus selenatarsenatis]GAM15163.1 D-beta-hydroxybutyrate dehydrogenase [Mesobacillus selenatarsenatis SF-1]
MVKDKVVMITGAAQGIGYEIGKCFAEQGGKVFLTDLQEDAIEKAAASLRELGHEAAGLKCDVTSEKDIEKAVAKCIEHFGTVDVLINNAGLQYVSMIEDFPTEKFELLIKVMLTAPFIALKHVLPVMKKQGSGRVINMASINGLVGFAGKAAYNSAKHGVIGLTKVAALETAEHGITVNAVCPGYVDTPLVRNQLSSLAETRNVPLEKVLEEVIFPLVPQKRLLAVEEIASYVMFLASDAAKGITGQAAVIDGGYTIQ